MSTGVCGRKIGSPQRGVGAYTVCSPTHPMHPKAHRISANFKPCCNVPTRAHRWGEKNLSITPVNITYRIFRVTLYMRSVSAKEQMTCCPEKDVKVYYDGSCVLYREYQLSVTHCPMDVTWFPFDDQFCDLKFESETHESYDMNITVLKGETPIDYLYEPNSEWDLSGEI